MLDEQLDNYMEVALSPEKYRLCADLISYLESIEYEEIQDQLINLMHTPFGDEVDRVHKTEAQVWDDWHHHLKTCVKDQLISSGITPEDHIGLRDLHDLAMGLMHIAGHEDISGIMACCMLDASSENRLVEVLQLVTTVSADHWLALIDRVEKEVIRRIIEMSRGTIESEYKEMEDTAEYMKKIRVYSEFCDQRGESNLQIFKFVQRVVLGGLFNTYLQSGVLHNLFEGSEMHKLSLELYGFALISSDAKNDPVNAVRTMIEQYLEDAQRISLLSSEMQEINAAFVAFYQNTTKGLL